MFPETSDFRSDWLDRLQLILLHHGFARLVISSMLICFVWISLGHGTARGVVFAGDVFHTPSGDDQAVAIDLQDTRNLRSQQQLSFGLPDLTSPPRDFPVSTRPRLWDFWKKEDRREAWVSSRLKLVADEPDDPDAFPPEPDITEPGPDMGDYPNSAFTLPKGRAYIELAPVTLQTADAFNAASYNFPFLLRYGLTDDVEIRLIGSGLSSVFDPGNTVSGFAPLIVDTKVHLWDDEMDRFIPAASLEVFILTNWGSATFQGGIQPSINLNLDFPITEKTNIEMTFGYSGLQDALVVETGRRFVPRLGHTIPELHKTNVDADQFSYQWAIEQAMTDKLELFVHGYYTGRVYAQDSESTVVGVGWFYELTKRVMLFSSYNAGIDKASPPFSTQFGMAFAL